MHSCPGEHVAVAWSDTARVLLAVEAELIAAAFGIWPGAEGRTGMENM